jgi:prolyl 4-hydroxylase
MQVHARILLPEECEDEEKLCPDWAESGECSKNKRYMTGDSFSLGACRKSCGECEMCAPGDMECRSRNRVRAGYLPLGDL